MPRFEVVPAELERLSNSALAEENALVVEIDQLARMVESLVGTSWLGQDSLAFASAFNEWRAGADQVTASLARISALLANSQVSYDDTENIVSREMLNDTRNLSRDAGSV